MLQRRLPGRRDNKSSQGNTTASNAREGWEQREFHPGTLTFRMRGGGEMFRTVHDSKHSVTCKYREP